MQLRRTKNKIRRLTAKGLKLIMTITLLEAPRSPSLTQDTEQESLDLSTAFANVWLRLKSCFMHYITENLF